MAAPLLLVGSVLSAASCATPPDTCRFSADNPHLGQSPKGSGYVIGKMTIQGCTAATNVATTVHIDWSVDGSNWSLAGEQVDEWSADNATYLQGVASSNFACRPAKYRTWGRAFAFGNWTDWNLNEQYVGC